ncbi:MAG: glycosyltransferase [Acidobacteriota bacterium]|jgi:dolichol-phosphate mannosyltransferase
MLVERNFEKLRLGVVSPMANEANTAVEFVQRVLDNCRSVPHTNLFVVIDKISTDATRALLEELSARQPKLRVVWAPENKCVVDAYVRGYREALTTGCDWILEMDAGFSHQPDQIPAFLACIREGCDCAFGSRFAKSGAYGDGPWKRKFISRGGTYLANLMLGTRLSDMTSGFELFSSEALRLALEKGIQSKAHFFQTEIRAYCHGLRIREVPIHYCNPSSQMKSSVLFEAMIQLARLTWLRIRGDLHIRIAESREDKIS